MYIIPGTNDAPATLVWLSSDGVNQSLLIAADATPQASPSASPGASPSASASPAKATPKPTKKP